MVGLGARTLGAGGERDLISEWCRLNRCVSDYGVEKKQRKVCYGIAILD